jgi:hypothetical protein
MMGQFLSYVRTIVIAHRSRHSEVEDVKVLDTPEP